MGFIHKALILCQETIHAMPDDSHAGVQRSLSALLESLHYFIPLLDHSLKISNKLGSMIFLLRWLERAHQTLQAPEKYFIHVESHNRAFGILSKP